MTVAVALVDPPREGIVCTELVDHTPLSPADGVTLYEGLLADFFATMAETNVDLLVNYPQADDLPGESTTDPEAEIRAIAGRVLDAAELDRVRFEVQIGSTPSAQIGNAITHLLRDEEETSAAFLDHRVPLLERSVVDQAAISLRRNETVVGPAQDGGVYLAGFRAPIDFTDVLEGRSIERIVSRSVGEAMDVAFVRRREVVDHPRDLKTVVSLLRARREAERAVPKRTMAAIDELGLWVSDDGEIRVADTS